MRIFYHRTKNVGDTLTPVILSHFLGAELEFVDIEETNKFIAVGSIIYAIRQGDTVWGTGAISNQKINIPKDVKFLALRGKLTKQLLNIECDVLGDPALLMPLIYNPTIEQTNEIGIVEHYVDKGLYKGEGKRIDVKQHYEKFIDEIKSCKKIISSSLHGLIIADAYGIPCEWIKLSDRVIGEGFKFRDYLSGTNRTDFTEPLTKENLKIIQDKLIEALCDYQ